ncbi:hypothetical protein [Agitococcus lubricus]|uniref:Uncharacterized protein n=1 Tax=Agitococcus lubricus TaxID=1077255 RepID=A0A2T5J2R6_9GAMM|nr:hypothetical protein [Agitococcus lubricus]PTQ90809.1 hypothetical protein C8N29_102209 [Agitococcus lubricus]
MHLLLVLLCFLSSLTQADIFKGQEKDGYFYPEFQAWRVVEARYLSPINVKTDVSAVPRILLNSMVYVAPNYFTLKSVNSGGDMIFPACFVQDKKDTQAQILSDDGIEFIGDYVDFKPAKKGLVYIFLYNSILLTLKQETEFDISQRDKFEEAVAKRQNMQGHYQYIESFKTKYAEKPDVLAKYLPEIIKNGATLLQKKACDFMPAPQEMATEPKSLRVIFPQLNQKIVVPDGVMSLAKNINMAYGNTHHKQSRSVEYVRKNQCVSEIFFSHYTVISQADNHREKLRVTTERTYRQHNASSMEGVITKGFMGTLDTANLAITTVRSTSYMEWLKLFYQLRTSGLKVEGLHLSDMFAKASGASCHREQYRKKFNVNQMLTLFDGFQGFTLEGKLLEDYPSKWETNDLLVLTAPEYKIKIYDSGQDELTVFLEYPIVKE